MKNVLTAIILVLSSTVVCLGASRFMPLVTNFNNNDYHAQLQNWCVAIDDDCILYIGNNEGLLTFDGYTWECIQLPGKTILRSLLYDDGILYAGTFEDFGFFRRTDNGVLYYTSLVDHSKNISLKDEEIWNIKRFGDNIYFQSFANVYVYNPKTGELGMLTPSIAERGTSQDDDGKISPLAIYSIGGSVYLQRVNSDLYRLEKNSWRRYWPRKLFGSHIKGFVLPDRNEGLQFSGDDIPDGTLVFTQDNLIFKVTNGCPLPFPTQIDKELFGCRINHVATADDGTIYVGTVGNGLFHIDRRGNLMEHFNTHNGLQNNTVLGMGFDHAGNLWLTLDDGISIVHAAMPFRILRPGALDPYLGMSYGIGRLGGNILIATNQGAYSYDYVKEKISLIPGTKGQNWFVRTFNGQTFIGGNDQTLIIDSDGTSYIEPTSGTDIKKGYINRTEVLLMSTYYPLRLYRRDEQNRWRFANVVSGVAGPMRQLEIDVSGTVWAAHLTNGLFKIRINSDLDSVAELKHYKTLEADSIARRWFVMKIRGQIVFTHGTGFYTYDEESDSFKPAAQLNEALGAFHMVRGAESIDDTHFWLSCADSYNFIEYDGSSCRLLYSIPMSVFPRQNNGDNSYTICSSEGTYFTVTDAIGFINQKNLSKYLDSSALKINTIGSTDAQGALIRLPIRPDGDIPELPGNNMKVVLSYPNHFRSQHLYRFSMSDGSKSIDSISEIPKMSYSMLSWGHHTLHCGVLNSLGDEIESIEYEFVVPKPWVLRWWAISGYVILLIVVIYVAAYFNTRRQVRQRQVEFEKARAEQDRHIREQELIIAEQQKRILENELSAKSKELASMALGAYARQQALDNMRASVADLRRKGSPMAEAERVLRDISTTDGDNRMFWDIFEKNFDLIHEHFFRNLRKAFPALTPADLKFCALLRMNLSTKEISRFTNLSIRGVETARYRLRKKFNLGPDDKLVQFLIEFKLDED